MLKKDTAKLTINEIEGSKKGMLATKIVYNTIIENHFKIWFICNSPGNRLFYITINDGVGGTVAFTDYNIAFSALNNNLFKPALLKAFGSEIILSRLSLFYVKEMLNENNVAFLGTILVNPTREFFTPISLHFFSKLDSLKVNEYEIDLDLEGGDYVALKYDKETMSYLSQENDDYLDLLV